MNNLGYLLGNLSEYEILQMWPFGGHFHPTFLVSTLQPDPLGGGGESGLQPGQSYVNKILNIFPLKSIISPLDIVFTVVVRRRRGRDFSAVPTR